MENRSLIKEANGVMESLSLTALHDRGIRVDRVSDNPEAGRYFILFADWTKVSCDEIFSQLDMDTAQKTQVYVDLVFCKTFCEFCAFYGVVPRSYRQMKEYVDCLKKEIVMLKDVYFRRGFKVESLEFGGGTPTFLPYDLLQDITESVYDNFPVIRGAEFSFEASPETLIGDAGMKKLVYLKSKGASRVSLGIQSFNEAVLQAANRPHTSNDIDEAVNNIKQVGFKRINVDLMVGLYGQTQEQFLDSIQKTVEYGIDIVELYTLRYFDTKAFVPMKKKLVEKSGFLNVNELLVARIAADILLRKAGYVSFNGRTYEKADTNFSYYAAYYEGNFKGKNTLGVGRKSNSNLYPWQYANYRDLSKYQKHILNGELPVAAGTRLTRDQLAAKKLTGSFQLPGVMAYYKFRNDLTPACVVKMDDIMSGFLDLGLLREVEGGFEKTSTGFLFIEEMLKQVYDVVATPYNTDSLFLGKKQQC